MYIFFAIVVFLFFFTLYVLRLPTFGHLPTGARLARIQALPNYDKGELLNLSYTPMKPEGVSYWMMFRALIQGNPRKRPAKTLPSVKPDFTSVSGTKLTWFGHSSYLIQTGVLKILVDPVFSPSTSPFTFIGNKNFEGTDFVKAEDFPALDVLLITHDHYDHLDYQSILKLKDRVKHFVTSVGVGEHLECWGIAKAQIHELAWEESTLVSGLKFTAVPARHFTGRQFKRNQTLWSAFVLETADFKLFLGGDSGYDTHFAQIGETYGPFELAVLECGQYHEYWPYIHMFPENTVKAAQDLGAKVLLPVHWGKFSLSLHDWDDSILRVTKSAAQNGQSLTTPLLGETVEIGRVYPDKKWWLNVDVPKQ